jgi:hypothetical protein
MIWRANNYAFSLSKPEENPLLTHRRHVDNQHGQKIARVDSKQTRKLLGKQGLVLRVLQCQVNPV